MRAIAAATVLAVVVTCIGCDQPPAATPRPAAVIPLAIQEPVTVDGVVTEVCMAALLEGTLVRDERTGLGVAVAGSGVVPVRWPKGWTAVGTTPVMLVDADGGVVARVGDRVAMGGGMGPDPVETWVACATDIKVVP
jgi:hypothetical protein